LPTAQAKGNEVDRVGASPTTLAEKGLEWRSLAVDPPQKRLRVPPEGPTTGSLSLGKLDLRGILKFPLDIHRVRWI
jgi:hypothetical protein